MSNTRWNSERDTKMFTTNICKNRILSVGMREGFLEKGPL